MELVEIYRYLLVALGIGLVIFVHEAGHFLAARYCKVRVETFSLGFGPRLVAWTRGATTYQIALVPLGGYVKMAGEESFGSDAPPAPDELQAKSVGQRFLIYSGGVIMNVVFGVVVFPIILMYGVPFADPLIGEATPGGPAWEAGIQPGTRVLAVNGEKIVSFEQILTEVALSPTDEVRLRVVEPAPPGQDPVEREVALKPEYREGVGLYMIEVEHAADPSGVVMVTGDPAREAGIESGDRLVAVRGSVPEDPLARQLRDAIVRGGPLALELERAPGEGDEGAGDGAPAGARYEAVIEPQLVPATKKPLLGIQQAFQRVRALRPNPRIAEVGLRTDDHVLAVDGRTVAREGDLRALLLAAAGRAAELRVRRGDRVLDLVVPAMTRAELLDLTRDVALAPDAESTVVAVSPQGPAEAAGLLDGDRVVRIGPVPVETWEDILEVARTSAREDVPLTVRVQRDGESSAGGPVYVDLDVRPAPLERAHYGLALTSASYVYRASGPGEAIKIGLQSTWKFTRDAWNTLKGMVLGQVSSENLGGIITIGAVSYSWASVGLAKLFFFLCMLSLNLAFLNVLPIPVLDGGHLFFLLVEKIKGSPVSERVLGYSQMVGLVLILSLMIYVTWNDIERWFF